MIGCGGLLRDQVERLGSGEVFRASVRTAGLAAGTGGAEGMELAGLFSMPAFFCFPLSAFCIPPGCAALFCGLLGHPLILCDSEALFSSEILQKTRQNQTQPNSAPPSSQPWPGGQNRSPEPCMGNRTTENGQPQPIVVRRLHPTTTSACQPTCQRARRRFFHPDFPPNTQTPKHPATRRPTTRPRSTQIRR